MKIKQLKRETKTQISQLKADIEKWENAIADWQKDENLDYVVKRGLIEGTKSSLIQLNEDLQIQTTILESLKITQLVLLIKKAKGNRYIKLNQALEGLTLPFGRFTTED